MRLRRLILALAVLISGVKTYAHASTRVLQTNLSIAGCSQPATLDLGRTSRKYDLDPDEFNQIAFHIGAQTFEFATATPQMRLRPSMLNPPEDYAKLKGISVDRTGYFLRASFRSGLRDHVLMMFLGWPYGSDPGSLLVVGFRSDCSPYRVLQSDTYELLAVQKDASGSTTLIGKHSLSQVMAGADGAWVTGKPYATTYDPYSVYRINPKTGLAEYSLEESRYYNLAHYCWAGPHMSEAKAVVYNRTKKGQMECMSAARAMDMVH